MKKIHNQAKKEFVWFNYTVELAYLHEIIKNRDNFNEQKGSSGFFSLLLRECM